MDSQHLVEDDKMSSLHQVTVLASALEMFGDVKSRLCPTFMVEAGADLNRTKPNHLKPDVFLARPFL